MMIWHIRNILKVQKVEGDETLGQVIYKKKNHVKPQSIVIKQLPWSLQ